MDNNKILEHIYKGGDYYLKLLGDAPHMEIRDDGFCTTINPKQGEKGCKCIFNFRFDGMTVDEIEQKIKQVKEKKMHTFWGFQPEKVLTIISKYYPKSSEGDSNISEEDEEDYMALLSYEKPEYTSPAFPIAVKKVDNINDFKIWADITNEVLSGGFPIIHHNNHFHLCSSGTMKCYLGYHGTAPVSTCATLNNDGVASLEFVATLKEYQRKGLGRAVCSTAINEVFSEGAEIITLRAFGPGKHLYKSLGFKVY